MDKSAGVVISHVKSVFARHGIPETVVCDNMPFNSNHFLAFACEWGFQVTTSSPLYAQSNGQAGRMVETVKSFLNKAVEDGGGPYIALLEYHNTPLSGLPYSPAQMAMSRQLRSKIPITKESPKPAVVHPHGELKQRQDLYK